MGWRHPIDHAREQHLQVIKSDPAGLWRLDPRQMKTDGAIEHPGWDLQTSLRPVCHEATQKCRYGAAFNHFVDVDHTTKPGMPRIKDFPRFGHMGVMLLRCTTRNAFIRHTATGRPGRSTKSNARGQGWLRRTMPLPLVLEPNREMEECSPSPPGPPAHRPGRIWRLTM